MICPICGRQYSAPPAVSRADGSEICPVCGAAESMAVSPGDTIDVAPIIYNDGTIKGTALMRVSYPTLYTGSPAYS